MTLLAAVQFKFISESPAVCPHPPDCCVSLTGRVDSETGVWPEGVLRKGLAATGLPTEGQITFIFVSVLFIDAVRTSRS
jgi:hypothetical protein